MILVAADGKRNKEIARLYSMQKMAKESGDPDILASWRKLQTSDHFYYMCTKWFAEGDVHKYFNPYDSPYDSYINFMNVLDNLRLRCSASLSPSQNDVLIPLRT